MKHINNIKNLFCGALLLFAVGASFTSCTEWLDKDPDSIVAADEAFKNFRNFQGYIEEIYNCIPDKEKCNWCPSWNWGDDEVFNPEAYDRKSRQVDLGNYRSIWTNASCWLNRDQYNPSSTDKFSHSLWPHSWYCIRKCNLGIENIGSLIGTDEERDLLLGQMYFFRAWWHFELMCYFGGMPYVDEAFVGDVPNLPRLSFQECAERCAADFKEAARLLPIDWDKTSAGAATSGKNDLRINKIMALSYLGKCYLWAASPLMENGAQLGASKGGSNAVTYKYNTEYAKLAADALGQVITLVENGETNYALAEYQYVNIYDHIRMPGSKSNFSDIFYTVKESWKMPGSTEAIFRGLSSDGNGSNWNTSKVFGPKLEKLVEHDNVIHQPTGNLIDQYPLSNGQPIYLVKDGSYVENPAAKTPDENGVYWDPTHPYRNRDPRFYHDIVFDGFKYVSGEIDTEKEDQRVFLPLIYCSLYTGGAMRDVAKASSTGYFCQKLIPHQCNAIDNYYGFDKCLHCYLPYMRLADIYLMYAEAVDAMSGPTATSSTCSLTAIDAINVLRDRVNSDEYPMAKVPENLTADKYIFMDEIRRERAVELAFEGFRWCDLQRWLLLTEPPYTKKYSHEFDRSASNNKTSWYERNDPKDAKVDNFRTKELITRNFDAKHYWFPLPDKEVYLSHEFKQNPGW